MKNTLKPVLILFGILFASVSANAQARLTIENNSMRSMAIKIMKGHGGKGTLHKITTIEAYSTETIYFSETNYYFTKTKAVLRGKDPVYRKGEPFRVTNDDTGYSVMTLTFSITESAIPQATGGRQISKTEFDQN